MLPQALGPIRGPSHELESITPKSGDGRGFDNRTLLTSGGDRTLHTIGNNDGPHVLGGSAINDGSVLRTNVGSSALVVGGGLVVRGGGTLAGRGIYETNSSAAAWEGVDDNRVLFKVADEGTTRCTRTTASAMMQ
jgi:hypothetical protein